MFSFKKKISLNLLSLICFVFPLGVSFYAIADELDDQIAAIEKSFWKKKRWECFSTGRAAAKNLTLAAGASCSALWVASQWKEPVSAAISSFSGVKSTDDDSSKNKASGSFLENRNYFIAATAMAAPTMGYLGAAFFKPVKDFADLNTFQLWSSITYWGLDPEEVILMNHRDQLELKFELLKELSSGSPAEVEVKYSVVSEVIQGLNKIILNKHRSWCVCDSRIIDCNTPKKLPSWAMAYVDAILNFPLRTKPLNLTPSEGQEKLKEFFKDTFDPAVVAFFNDQIERVIANSQLPLGSKHRDRTNLYLIGPGGTGKTDSSEAFAKVFDLPFCKIEASSLTPKDFSGYSGYSDSNVRLKLGKLLECLVQSQSSDGKTYLNGVLFIDEMDHLFNSTLHGESFEHLFKPLLSGSIFKDQGTGIEIDTSPLIVVGAGNGPLLRRLGADPSHIDAMNRRFSIIEYKKLDLERRKKVGVDKFLKNISLARGYEVTAEDSNYVRDTIVPYDHERSDGVGGLEKVINQLVIHRKNQRSLDSFDYKNVFSRTVVSSNTKKQDNSTQTEVADASVSDDLSHLSEEDLKAFLKFKEFMKTMKPLMRVNSKSK